MSVNGNSQLPLSVSDDLESVGTSPASLPALGAELPYASSSRPIFYWQSAECQGLTTQVLDIAK